ncbi:MAG: PTS sugar transporter subunit IIB [Lachnospiraceae bacterium]|jgi:PTS system ascorbate-specific IIB component|nr:PTS sugar transporter subunit IIB [Lachnospiraceae bacterium]
MDKENLSFLVCCANGGGTSLMCKMSLQRALDKLGIKPKKLHHCALAEGKSSATRFDVVFCPRTFEGMFASAKEKGTIVIGLRNVMSSQEIEEKMREFGLAD